MPRILVTLLAVAALLTPAAARATTVLPVSDAELVDHSHLVVRAQVVASLVTTDAAGRIVTDTELRVVETLAGAATETVTVRTPGGVLASGEGRYVWGTPRFTPGDEVLVFLRARDGGTWQVTGWNQGVFHELAGAAGPAYARPYRAAHDLAPRAFAADGGDPERGWDREGFLAWIRGRADGDPLPAAYRVELVPAPGWREKFELLNFDGPIIRWFEFDAGEEVVWRRHADGLAGLADGGATAFRRALRAWNDEPNTPVRLVDGGTTTVSTGSGGHSPDGNTVHFDDDHAIFGGPACTLGVPLAAAEVRLFVDRGELWRGLPTFEAIEAEIYVAGGLGECMGESFTFDRVVGILIHELGHTLGLHHPCERTTTPCDSRERAAVMQNHANWHDRELPVDDAEGLRYLYDASFDEADRCRNRAGGGDFCKVCGPCDLGEGDCDRDADCAFVFNGFCAADVGADYGFAPSVDVCERAPFCEEEPGGIQRIPSQCAECGPCPAGIGHCTKDADCHPGLVCRADFGSHFGYLPNVDVCLPEPGSGIAGCPLPLGHPDLCAVCGPCDAGEGDCDTGIDCAGELVCGPDVGPDFGYATGVDVCVVPELDFTGPTCRLPPGDPDYCRDCGPCRPGEGDCDRDTDCVAGASCVDDVGADHGFGPGIDVCRAVDGDLACPWPPGHGHYCRDCGPCTAGEGDCDRDTDCAPGLTCADDVGAEHGFGPGIDVCVDPVDDACPWPPGHGHYCRDCGPCAAGQGDCDRDTDCADGLACVQDVGAEHGFGPGIDVCR